MAEVFGGSWDTRLPLNWLRAPALRVSTKAQFNDARVRPVEELAKEGPVSRHLTAFLEGTSQNLKEAVDRYLARYVSARLGHLEDGVLDFDDQTLSQQLASESGSPSVANFTALPSYTAGSHAAGCPEDSSNSLGT